jgi:hypothetical protein
MKTAVALVFAIGFTAIAAREHLARGGPRIARTIASGSSNSPRDAEAALLLYEWASRNLPRGATVAAFKPKSRGEDATVNRITHGQLPHHRVVPAEPLDADYAITFGAPLADPRYAHHYETRVATVWKRMH